MKSTLYLKFIVIYIIFGFLSIFTVATLSSTLIINKLESEAGYKLYKQASLTSSEYLPGYFTDSLTYSNIQIQLNGLSSFSNAEVWFTDHTGKVICTSKSSSIIKGTRIKKFDPAECGNNQYLTGNYHDYFSDDVISVIAPVTHGFATKGYLLLHKPYNDIRETQNQILVTAYITIAILYVFSLIVLVALHFFVLRPLSKISEAAKQYALGNLDYEIDIDTQDEIGYLSASLNYMSDQLKDMNDYQKKFIANVSHDFRSPLTSIKGYITAIADGTIPPEMYDKYLNIILFETERLTDLTQDLLTLNEFDTKELLLDKTEFDIHEMIRQTAASFEGRCRTKKISIELLFVSKKLTVFADRPKIQQVLYNLLDNAIKFSNNDSTVSIETSEKNETVFVSIKDQGIGIPKKSINQIWERFYKTDLSRGKDKKGTGLGLAIVKEIIKAHGENINVVSTEDVGTEFIFSLSKPIKKTS